MASFAAQSFKLNGDLMAKHLRCQGVAKLVDQNRHDNDYCPHAGERQVEVAAHGADIGNKKPKEGVYA
jgi:hypothetical protein